MSRAQVLRKHAKQARLELPGSRQHGNELGHLAFFIGQSRRPLKKALSWRARGKEDQSLLLDLVWRSAYRLSVQWTQ